MSEEYESEDPPKRNVFDILQKSMNLLKHISNVKEHNNLVRFQDLYNLLSSINNMTSKKDFNLPVEVQNLIYDIYLLLKEEERPLVSSFKNRAFSKQQIPESEINALKLKDTFLMLNKHYFLLIKNINKMHSPQKLILHAFRTKDVSSEELIEGINNYEMENKNKPKNQS